MRLLALAIRRIEAEMRINFFLLIIVIGVHAVFAAKQSVAVLPSDGEEVFNASQLKLFTDKTQE